MIEEARRHFRETTNDYVSLHSVLQLYIWKYCYISEGVKC